MKISRWLQILSGLLAVAWLAFAGLGHALAGWLAARLGSALIRLSEGKIPDPATFFRGRFQEGLWWLTWAWCILLVGIGLNRWLRSRAWYGHYRWILNSILGFAGLNLWLLAAGHTNLFWAFMWQGSSTHNLARFYFKETLLPENTKPSQAILMGSSQTRAQIEENVLNQLLGEKLWTTELHYPGSRGYDLLLTLRHLDPGRYKNVICYLSENYFYLSTYSEAFPLFFAARDWPEAFRLGSLKYASWRPVLYAFLGQAMPLFRFRDVLAQRALGTSITQLEQSAYNAHLESSLEKRAQEIAPSYRRDAHSQFQMRAFEEFVQECENRGLRVILCCGQLNPVLSRHLDPSLRIEMQGWLRDLQRQHPKLALCFQEDLLVQTEKDYADLTHATLECQNKFTHQLAGWLEKMDAKSHSQQAQWHQTAATHPPVY